MSTQSRAIAKSIRLNGYLHGKLDAQRRLNEDLIVEIRITEADLAENEAMLAQLEAGLPVVLTVAPAEIASAPN